MVLGRSVGAECLESCVAGDWTEGYTHGFPYYPIGRPSDLLTSPGSSASSMSRSTFGLDPFVSR